jgi:hypothetical protein
MHETGPLPASKPILLPDIMPAFLLIAIEASIRRRKTAREAMRAALARYGQLTRVAPGRRPSLQDARACAQRLVTKITPCPRDCTVEIGSKLR